MLKKGTESAATQERDTGAIALASALALHLNAPVDYGHIKERRGKGGLLSKEDLRAIARDDYGFRVKETRVTAKSLHGVATPCVLEAKNGDFWVLIAREESGDFLFHDCRGKKPRRAPAEELLEEITGNVLLLKPSASAAVDRFSIQWFINELTADRLIVANVVVSSLFVQIFALTAPLFTMIIIDKVFSSAEVATLRVLIVGLVIVAGFDLLIGGLRRRLLSHTSHRVDVKMVTRLFRRLTELPLAYFLARQTGDTVSRVREVEPVRSFFTGPALTTLIDLPFIVIFLVVLTMFNAVLAMIIVVAIGICFVACGVVTPNLRSRLQQKQSLATDDQSFLVETVFGIETIKALAIEPAMQRRWEDHMAEQAHYGSAVEELNGNVMQFVGFIQKLTTAATLGIGGMAVVEGNMTAGQLIAFNMMVGRVMGPSVRVATMLQQIFGVGIATKRIGEVWNAPSETAITGSGGRMPKVEGTIEFEKVGFRYGEDEPAILSDVSVKIPAGQVVGVVGTSGSGKSTFLRLIQRLVEPTSGKVTIDGFAASTIDPTWLRKSIGVVLQDNVLFNRSVKENLQLVNPNVTDDQMRKICDIVGASEFIEELPDGYDTVVGERGSRLSIGQRQRIAFARALLVNPKILILDEATSALDYESEMRIQRNLQHLCKGRTVIMVAHRLSTLKVANRILVIEHGRIIEDGTPDELLARGGRYAQLHKLQNP